VIAAAIGALAPLTLASTSRQRVAILRQLGVPFEAVAPAYEEHDRPGALPGELALEHAAGKARSVDAMSVLGVDTLVAVGGRVLQKPADEHEARAFLELLSGRSHSVHSGLCLRAHGREELRHAATEVRFRRLDEDDLRWYLEGGEWAGRAGGYAVQGRGAALVAGIAGDYWNVVGLPVPALLSALEAFAARPSVLAAPTSAERESPGSSRLADDRG
jgi:septum formation protein